MSHVESHELIARIERLERRNRYLTLACGLCLSIPLLAIIGWQSPSDTARVKRLEIVNDKNVPLITLDASRTGEGGSIIMRDSQGEKRAWWEVAPEKGAFTLTSAKPDGTNDTTLGLQVGPKNARVAIISKNGALLSSSMEADTPQIEMYGTKGNVLFAAPWKPVGKSGE
jgi:hypothetical protein